MTIAVEKAHDLNPETWSEDGKDACQHVTVGNTSAIDQDQMSREAVDKVLAQRAARLAEVQVEKDSGEQIDLLLVRLGREVYGLEAQYVDRIDPVDVGCITRVPRVPEWVAGVVNLRGRILPVVDLLHLFGLPSAPGDVWRAESDGSAPPIQTMDETSDKKGSCLVTVKASEMDTYVALLVDGVLTVETLPASRVQEATGTIRGLRPEYVTGVTERREGAPSSGNGHGVMVVVLDLPALLTDDRLIIHEEIV
jgi:purine-binding chemotaxis protein CheW